MKIYVKENGVTIVGKAWQIRSALRHYMRHFETVKDWTQTVAGK